MDATELGFFEVAIDVVRGAVDHRQYRAAGGDELMVTRGAVVEVAVHGAAHHRAVEVELGSIDRHLRLVDRRAGAGLAGLALFQLLGRHQVAQLPVAPRLAGSLGQGFIALGEASLGLAQGQAEAVLVDGEQHVAALDHLVVTHLDLLDQPGHIRGDLDHVGADVAVAGPGGKHVVHHHLPHEHGGEGHYQQGQDHTAQGQQRFFHGSIRFRQKWSTAPSSTAYRATLNNARCQTRR
ncbi:hypothetical protein D3C76_392990 [compost metagenome]